MFSLTTDAVGVFVRSAQEVRQGHEQGGEAGQQSPASNEPRTVDSTPKETHKDDEDSVSHLDMKQQCGGKDSARQALWILLSFPANLIKSCQHPRLLTGEAVASLDGGDGALHAAGHQKLCQLQQTVTQHEELQRSEGVRETEAAMVTRVKLRLSSSVRLQEGNVAVLISENNIRMASRKTFQDVYLSWDKHFSPVTLIYNQIHSVISCIKVKWIKTVSPAQFWNYILVWNCPTHRWNVWSSWCMWCTHKPWCCWRGSSAGLGGVTQQGSGHWPPCLNCP